jgi:hypothetical protein
VRKTAAGLCLVAGLTLLGHDEAVACGDKLLVIRRPVRSQRAHGAVQRASILVFLDARGHLQDALAEMRLERDLRLAGHELTMVRTRDELARAFRSGDHDVLIADVEEAMALDSTLPRAAGSPTLLPIVVNPTGDEWSEAAARFACIRRSPIGAKHYLAVIEEAIVQRQARERSRPSK